MKLEQVIILSVAVALFIIGIHQSFLYGVAASYWIFMFTVALLLLYRLRANRYKQPDTSQANTAKNDKKPVKTKKH